MTGRGAPPTMRTRGEYGRGWRMNTRPTARPWTQFVLAAGRVSPPPPAPTFPRDASSPPYSKYTRTPFNEYTGTHGNNTGTVRAYS
jgi:hypothetical protein